MYLNQIKLKPKLILIDLLSFLKNSGISEKSKKNSDVNNKVDLDKRMQYRLEK